MRSCFHHVYLIFSSLYVNRLLIIAVRLSICFHYNVSYRHKSQLLKKHVSLLWLHLNSCSDQFHIRKYMLSVEMSVCYTFRYIVFALLVYPVVYISVRAKIIHLHLTAICSVSQLQIYGVCITKLLASSPDVWFMHDTFCDDLLKKLCKNHISA